MADNTAKLKNREEKTFYLYDYNETLSLNTKKIYSPFNVMTYWRDRNEDSFIDPDFVVFEKWEYTLKTTDSFYEEKLEWLSFYNTEGGTLSAWLQSRNKNNGRFYKNDWIHIVRSEKIESENVSIKVEKVETIVQQIPVIIAQTMNITQLEDLAKAWGIEIPENIREAWDSEQVKEKIIQILKESNKLS